MLAYLEVTSVRNNDSRSALPMANCAPLRPLLRSSILLTRTSTRSARSLYEKSSRRARPFTQQTAKYSSQQDVDPRKVLDTGRTGNGFNWFSTHNLLMLLIVAASGSYVLWQQRQIKEIKDELGLGRRGLRTFTFGVPHYADEEGMAKALKQLRQGLLSVSHGSPRTADDVDEMISTDVEDVDHHAHSDWSTSNSPVKPFAVVYPMCTEDVIMIARTCTEHRVPMVPYGAGSSVEGSFSAPYSGFTIDFSRMDKILAFHEEDLDVVVQPGVNWVHLNNQLKPYGLFLPPDPSPTALIGGMIATNCSGPNAMRYGTMKDWVMNVTVVLADGRVIKTRHRPRKSSAGYDLTRLIVGAEGTLGFVTEATLKLAILPPNTAVATCSFSDIKTAAAAAVRIVREGISGLAALEFMDEAQMSVINKNGGTLGRDGKTKRLWKEEPTLFIKFSGTDKTMDDDVNRVKKITKDFGGSSLDVAKNEQAKASLWAARKEALWAMLAQRDEGTEIWSTDVAVPLSRLAEIIDISKQESSQLGLFNTVMGHVGDGNFHQSVMYHPNDPEEKTKVARCVENMMIRALEMEGTVSGEHAIGIGKKKSLEHEVGSGSLDVMRQLKLSLDPHWLMNPGKVFDFRDVPSQQIETGR